MTRGNRYNRYRGSRRSSGKSALAILLVLIILASVGVILMQRHVVYDESGTPQLDLPDRTETEVSQSEPVPPEKLELIIQEAPSTEAQDKALLGFSTPAEALTDEVWNTVTRQAEVLFGDAWNAVAVTLKDDTGSIWFDAASALPDTAAAAPDTARALRTVTGSEAHSIARLSCFADPKAAVQNVDELGLQDVYSQLFYDSGNAAWLDPAKPAARAYLCALAAEAAALGFDEILLTSVCYPAGLLPETIPYSEGDRAIYLLIFLQEMRAALEPYGTILSVELPESVITEGSDPAGGQVLTGFTAYVDRIYAATVSARAAELAAAVSAANETVLFIPELTAYDPSVPGCLIR